MRIDAGRWKGRTLLSVKGMNTRPTADMVKQAIFNILQGSIQNKSFCDLYAGTGSVALEALSRGARSAVLVEKDRLAVDVIRKNVEHIGCGDMVKVVANDVEYAAKILYGARFDIVFIDPPYGKGMEAGALAAVVANHLLAEDGLVIVQYTSDRQYSFAVPEELEITDQRKYGKTALMFLRRKESEGEM